MGWDNMDYWLWGTYNCEHCRVMGIWKEDPAHEK